MLPERDPEFENDHFNDMYHEHLRRKEAIRTRIEQMTREKNFLEQLAPGDVAYLFQKKQEEGIKAEKEAFDYKYSPEKAKRDLSRSPERSMSPKRHQPERESGSIMTKTYGMNLNLEGTKAKEEADRLNQIIETVDMDSLKDQEKHLLRN